jgi:hypothetical protein
MVAVAGGARVHACRIDIRVDVGPNVDTNIDAACLEARAT